jgi:hypothetical protein
MFLLFSLGKRLWWRPDAAGYTADVAEAGRYDAAYAEKVMREAWPTHGHGSLAVPVEMAAVLPIPRAESTEIAEHGGVVAA